MGLLVKNSSSETDMTCEILSKGHGVCRSKVQET